MRAATRREQPAPASHLSAKMLRLNTGIDLLGGQAQLMFDGMATAAANARGGRVKPLGIEGIDMTGWIGFFGPGGNGRVPPLPRQNSIARLMRLLTRRGLLTCTSRVEPAKREAIRCVQ